MKKSSFKSLSTALGNPAKRLASKRGFYNQSLLRHWGEIVGADLAQKTQPFSLQSRRNGRSTLTLNCLSAQASEITMRLEEIRIRINAYVGEDAIGTIKLNHQHLGFDNPPAKPVIAPTPQRMAPKELTQKLAQAENKELRFALKALSDSYYKRGNNNDT